MKIGYMRISKGEQTTALQEDALTKARCEKTFRDVMSVPNFSLCCNLPGQVTRLWSGGLIAWVGLCTISSKR